MPTAIPAAVPQITPRQLARLAWLYLRARYLARRMNRARARADRLGADRAGGRLLHFARRWLACCDEIAAILREPLPPEAAEMRKAFERRPEPCSRRLPGPRGGVCHVSYRLTP